MKVLVPILVAVGLVGALAAPAISHESANASPAPLVAEPQPVSGRILADIVPKPVPSPTTLRVYIAAPRVAVVKKKKRAVHHRHHAVHRTVRAVSHHKAPVGILPSAYRGPYYDARWESFRLCVINRESHGHYNARNPSSSASGAYQFLGAWTRTIQGWTGEHVAIWQMSRYAQDLAFWRALNHGRGASNWAGGGYHC